MYDTHDNARGSLARRIGSAASVAIVAGSMIGVGIFLNPRIVAEQLPTPGLFLAMWLFGGVIALAGAAAYAELGAMFPHAGGDYVYLRRAFGGPVSAAGGWILVLAVFPGSLATMAVALGNYQMPVLLGQVGYEPGLELLPGLSLSALTGLVIVTALTALNAAGAYVSGRTQVWVTAIPIVVLTLVGGYALLAGFGGPETAAATAEQAVRHSRFESFSIAFMAVYFAYSGWNAVGYVGGEVDNPRRNIPLGLFGGTVLVTAVYMLLCGAFVVVLGMGGVQGAFEAGSATASALFGPAAVLPIALLIAFAITGSINATVLGGARITYAMARDGALPRPLGTIFGPTRTPLRALGLQLVIASVLIVSGTFEQLLAMTSLAMLVLGALTVAALFVLKGRGDAAARASRGFGYPFLPALYFIFALFVVGVTIHSGVRSLSGASEMTEEFVFSLIGLAVFAGLFGLYTLVGVARRRVGRVGS